MCYHQISKVTTWRRRRGRHCWPRYRRYRCKQRWRPWWRVNATALVWVNIGDKASRTDPLGGCCSTNRAAPVSTASRPLPTPPSKTVTTLKSATHSTNQTSYCSAVADCPSRAAEPPRPHSDCWRWRPDSTEPIGRLFPFFPFLLSPITKRKYLAFLSADSKPNARCN